MVGTEKSEINNFNTVSGAHVRDMCWKTLRSIFPSGDFPFGFVIFHPTHNVNLLLASRPTEMIDDSQSIHPSTPLIDPKVDQSTLNNCFISVRNFTVLLIVDELL